MNKNKFPGLYNGGMLVMLQTIINFRLLNNFQLVCTFLLFPTFSLFTSILKRLNLARIPPRPVYKPFTGDK